MTTSPGTPLLFICVRNLGGDSRPEATASLAAGTPWVEIRADRGPGGPVGATLRRDVGGAR